jgi:hypothetical protein
MRQSRFVAFGVVLVLVPAAFAALFGWRAVLEQSAMGLFLLAGGLAVLGARVAAVEVGTVRVSWRHLVGASFLVVALANVTREVPRVLAGTASSYELLMAGWFVVMSCLLAFVGIDIARNGRHFDITPDVDRVVGL